MVRLARHQSREWVHGRWLPGRPVIYQIRWPTCWGMEGLALLRAWAGDHDEASRGAPRRGTPAAGRAGRWPATQASRAAQGPVGGYRVWSASYDRAAQRDLPLREPVHESSRPCRSARSSTRPAAPADTPPTWRRRVTTGSLGVDSSPEMRPPGPQPGSRKAISGAATCTGSPFRTRRRHRRVRAGADPRPSLAPVLAEFARVLRPSGHLVASTCTGTGYARLGGPPRPGPPGEAGTGAGPTGTAPGDYLRAALPLGLRVRGCEEPGPTRPEPPSPPEKITVSQWADWPWSLLDSSRQPPTPPGTGRPP